MVQYNNREQHRLLSQSKQASKLWRENKTFLVFITLMLVFRSAVADWNEVPTGSMKPTIVEGDRVLVNKLAYDIQIPFTGVSVWKVADPRRGDIVVFDSEAADIRLVKRVIGIPGDSVQLKNNILIINDYELVYQNVLASGFDIDKVEDLFGVKHKIRTHHLGSPLSNFDKITVPEDHYFVLGDNRDNSSDSRVIGLVPREEFVGKVKQVVLSLDYENFFIPRKERFFLTL